VEYIEVNCEVEPENGVEILIAYLSEIGYSMFEEYPGGVRAYIDKKDFSEQRLSETEARLKEHFQLKKKVSEIPFVNWNSEWEKNFQPVFIGNDICIRAEFHDPQTSYKYELIIQPKMAFGTGHHPTTYLMLEEILQLNISGKRILDMGCGTGILGILTSKMRAAYVLAVDNDSNALDNAIYNIKINQAANIQFMHRDEFDLNDQKFDIILANINRNIILQDLPLYFKHLKPDGMLMTSGYYMEDLPAIKIAAELIHLTPVKISTRENWCAASFLKK
jgi:ribosomal protein L11 methyltransferase